ncbi:MAG: hypothetical protein WC001_05095 [Desulfurivibrionaceae bacterium]
MEYFLGVVLAGVIIFVALHLRPLQEHEISSLATKRRKRNIEAYFQLDNTERSVNAEFKKSLNPRGVFYRVDLPLHSTASTVAALLKYKKHEWIVIAFEKGKQIGHLWVNKGYNNSSASIYLTINEALGTAVQHGYSSILMFHNHPNSNPNKYNCTQASETDLATASLWASTLNPGGINLAKYVCERGRHYRYWMSPSESFLPFADFTEGISKANHLSKFGNLLLHMERIF